MNTKNILVLVLTLSLITSPAFASWVDKWVEQKVVTGPDYFESQKKGYGSFGSYSARWSGGFPEKIASITPPSIDMGCGGIDIFMGGFSFLKAEYIVKRLKKMMGPAAAAFAYGIAMSALNAQAHGVLQDLQKVITDLNDLQLNQCAVVSRAKKFGESVYTESLQNTLSTKGLSDSWKSFQDSAAGKNTEEAATGAGVTAYDAVDGCPSELLDIFFTKGSILKNIGNDLLYSSELIDFIRGIVGDIEISDRGVFNYAEIGPCEQNIKIDILYSLTHNYIQSKNSSGDCTTPLFNIGGNDYNSIHDWVRQMIVGLGESVRDRTAFTPLQKSFLQTAPADLMKAITYAVVEGGNTPATLINNTAMTYSDYISSMMCYRMVNDLHGLIQNAVKRAKEVNSKKRSGQGCQKDIAEPAIDMLVEIQDRLVDLSGEIYDSFNRSLAELDTNIRLSEVELSRTRKFKKVAGNIITKLIGAGYLPATYKIKLK